MKRNTKISCDVSREADNMLKAYCKKHERSKGFLLEKMIRKFCGDDAEVKVKSKAKPKNELAVIEMPEFLNPYAWAKWLEFRGKAKFKKYKTDSVMKKLASMGDYDEQIKIVQNSIDMEYQGLFPLKKDNSFAKTTEHQDNLDSKEWAKNLDDVL